MTIIPCIWDSSFIYNAHFIRWLASLHRRWAHSFKKRKSLFRVPLGSPRHAWTGALMVSISNLHKLTPRNGLSVSKVVIDCIAIGSTRGTATKFLSWVYIYYIYKGRSKLGSLVYTPERVSLFIIYTVSCMRHSSFLPINIRNHPPIHIFHHIICPMHVNFCIISNIQQSHWMNPKLTCRWWLVLRRG